MKEGKFEIILRELLERRCTFHRSASEECEQRWDRIAKPIDGLGELEKMTAKIAGMTGSADVRIDRRAVAVMCGDNGVVREGVTQTGQAVTAQVTENIAKGISSVCLMAKAAKADVFAADLGVAAEFGTSLRTERKPSVLSAGLPPSGRVEKGRIADKKVASGTGNLCREPAMSREQAALAVCRGMESVREMADQGIRIIASGEMGIGNTTTAGAVAACLADLPPERTAGRGAGLSADGVRRKAEVIRRALSLHRPDPADALDVLSKVGGYDIAGMTGLFLGGALVGIPVVVDGAVSAAAAALAAVLCPGCEDFMLASHEGREPASGILLKHLGLKPVIHAGLALGEGTGAVMLFPLLDLALSLYSENITFEEVEIEAYQRLK